MALEKKIPLPNGFYATYWKLGGEPRINRDMKAAVFVMAGYKSANVRHETNAPVIWHDYEVRDAEFDKYFGTQESRETQCYNAAKGKENDPLLHDAKDV